MNLRTSLTLWMLGIAAGTAQGGVIIELVPDPPDIFGYSPGAVVTVEVRLIQSPIGSDQLLRLIELDFQATSSALTLSFPITHDRGTQDTADDIRFWRFDSLAQCRKEPSFCGFNHFTDDDLPAGLVDTRSNMMAMAYYALADNTAQLTLKGDGTPLVIGTMYVTMPPAYGSYVLNVVNAADVDVNNRRARVDFGFEPHTIWRAGQAAPNDVSGGRLELSTIHVDPCCVFGPGGCCPTLVSSVPPFTPVGQTSAPQTGTLWRSRLNTLRLKFSTQLFYGPDYGEVLIQELLPDGQFGPDLSYGFSFTVEGDVLRVRDLGSHLVDRRWYAIRNLGWHSYWAWPFEIHFPVVVGDFDGNRFTTPTDVSGINNGGAPSGPQPDQSRADINGDGFKTPMDVSIANASQGPPPAKPTGH